MRTRLAGLFVALLSVGVAYGTEQTCINPVVGVFGQANLPPHWWDSTSDSPPDPQPVYHTCVTDPRWRDTAAISYDSGAGEDMLFRIIHDANNVYLSWWIKSPPFGTPDNNVLYFGFPDSGAGGATEPAGDRIVKINLGTAATSEAATGLPINIATFRRDPTTGQGMSGDPVPFWLSGTARVWIHNPGVGPLCAIPVCNCTQNPPDFWAVQVAIPKANINAGGGAFALWYEVFTGTLAAPLVKFTWPRTGADITQGGFPVQEIYPAPSVWNTFKFSTGPGDVSCPGTGVSIGYANIGTTNSPDYRINYAQVPPAASHPLNLLFARPINATGVTIPAGKVLGTFRIANWGSLPHWEDGVPVDVLWSRIQCGTDASPNLTECGTNVPSSGDILNGTTATAANEIHFTWALTNAQLAPFASGAKRADSCMIVELSSSMSPGLVFSRRSVLKNMIFAHTSDYHHEAEASIKGLTPIAPDGRDVYIWVEVLNMPQSVARDEPVPQIPVRGGDRPNVAAFPKTVSVSDDRQLTQLNAAGLLAQEDLDRAMPTYRVHVYHDTGTKRTIGGVVHPILNAQGVFGYYVAYNPPVTGWRHLLEAQGFRLEELAPNFYRIRKVPNNGVVQLKIHIRSLHEGEADWPPLGGGPSAGGVYRFFLDAGPNFPHGSFRNGADGQFSVNAGLERMLGANTSVEAIVGYHAFDGKFGSNPHVWQLSGNVKQYFGPGPLHGFVNGGIGVYFLSPGNSTKFGGNVGAGVLYDISPRWGIEGVYNYHAISTSGSTTQFSTAQLGFRCRL